MSPFGCTVCILDKMRPTSVVSVAITSTVLANNKYKTKINLIQKVNIQSSVCLTIGAIHSPGICQEANIVFGICTQFGHANQIEAILLYGQPCRKVVAIPLIIAVIKTKYRKSKNVFNFKFFFQYFIAVCDFNLC